MFLSDYVKIIQQGEKMKIKEIIVVEGKHDSANLKKHFDCETIETSGTHLGNEVLRLIQIAQQKRGVIIFTDPDSPGEKIRTTINQKVSGCKNAFIQKTKAKSTKKVGIEHANKEDLMESLSQLMSYDNSITNTISMDDFHYFGFMGRSDSADLRYQLSVKLSIGKPNAKTLYKRLNMLQLNKDDIEELLKEIS